MGLRSCFAAGLAAFAVSVIAPHAAAQEAEAVAPVEAVAPAEAEAPGFDLEAFVDGAVAAYLREHDAPGVVVAVVRDDEVALMKGYGVADLESGEPASPTDQRYEIGSISKTFVWTLVMMLAEEGTLDLDADVNTYLRDYAFDDGGDPLTLNQIMAHRSGLEDTFAIFLPEVAALDAPEAFAVTEPATVFARGGTASYSNWASALAAKVAADAAGRPFEALLRERLLDPIGMDDTALREAAARPDQPPLAVSYRTKDGRWTPSARVEGDAFAPAGWMSATAEDMTRWMRFHLNAGEIDGERVMSPAAYARMRTSAFERREGLGATTHGFGETTLAGMVVYGHAGSLNGFMSNMQLAPEIGAGVFVVQTTDSHMTFMGQLPALVLTRLAEEAGVAADAPAPPADAEARARDAAGRYLLNRRAFSGLEKALSFGAVISVRADGPELVATGSPLIAGRFTAVAPDAWENRTGTRIGFERDAEGAVVRLVTGSGSMTADRVGPATEPRLLFASLGAAALFGLTTWLGLWRRFGRGAPATGTGRAIAAFDLAAALPAFAVIALFAHAAATLWDSGIEIFIGYPPDPLPALMLAASLTLAAGVLAALGAIPVWVASGWSAWRKLHHTLFAAALLWAGVMLKVWGLAFSGHAGS